MILEIDIQLSSTIGEAFLKVVLLQDKLNIYKNKNIDNFKREFSFIRNKIDLII
tara:strand:- start:1742 stop:1903 length:162 start_codon:yes stop_codon:yes gene_type:complete